MHSTRLVLVLPLLVSLAPAARASAGASASCPFEAGALPADTLPPGAPHGAAIPIDHIVVVMQENRSFDHYFGRLRPNGNHAAEGPPKGATNPDPTGGAPIPLFHQKAACEVADLDHGWNATHAQIDGGAMDGFTANNVVDRDPSGRRALGYHTKREIPFYFQLYRTFAMGDRYFASVPGPTYPNREYLLTATSFGHIRNDTDLSAAPKTIFEALDEAGVSWKVYYEQAPFAVLFKYVFTHADHLAFAEDFAADVAAGTLPSVSFVDSAFTGAEESDEHPPANLQIGQAWVAEKIQTLMASALWASSALILVYDEHGGYYDHVSPPPACVPDDIAPMVQEGDLDVPFDRYGVRVPMVVVSPFARRKFVSNVVRDHTSILRFIETRFDMPALTRRDANADPMLELFDFADPPFRKPPRLPKAKVSTKLANECAEIAAEASSDL